MNKNESPRDVANKSDGLFWTAPGVDLEEVLGKSQHVVIDGESGFFDPSDDSGGELEFETVVATEDDFEDDCPICEMMRKRVRKGERIELKRLKQANKYGAE